jgi:DNA-binding HxlR family transcriptional regulator
MNDAVVDLLNALAHPDALRVLEALLSGPATLPEIGIALTISPSALNYRMRKLEHAGLVRRGRSHGPWELGAAPEAVQDLLLTLSELGLSIKREQFELQREQFELQRKQIELQRKRVRDLRTNAR